MIRETLSATALIAWGVAIFVVLVLGVGVVGAKTEGWFITQHASNVRHGLNFTQGANARAENAITDYQTAATAGDAAHAAAALSEACSAADSIQPDEQYADVRQFAAAHCAGS